MTYNLLQKLELLSNKYVHEKVKLVVLSVVVGLCVDLGVALLVLFVDFRLVTVATDQTDGFKRFIRSAKMYNIPVEVRCTLHY
jgi:hypothetical protein